MENMIDFEYHYYRLKHLSLTIKKKYLALELYPYLKNMIERLNEAEQLLESFDGIEEIEARKDSTIDEIIKTLDFGRQVMHDLVDEGIKLYETLKQLINITFLSVQHPIPYAGYIIFYSPFYPDINIYKYECHNILTNTKQEEDYFYVNLERVTGVENAYRVILPSFEILVRKYLDIQHENVLLCFNDIYIPHQQVLEICKRELSNIIYKNKQPKTNDHYIL